MDTELLKTFLEVSKTRHFGRAAEALYLTQSAISFRIRQLENQLGVSLFTRHRNNIRLTSAGERLLPYAESLMTTWIMAKKEVGHNQQHELSIGGSASLWEVYLTPWLQTLYMALNNLHLEARISQRHQLVKQLHERQLDLLITTEAPKMDALTSQQVGQFSLSLLRSQKCKNRGKNSYIKLEWGADFHQHQCYMTETENVPILVTTSAQLTREMLHTTGACAFLPTEWCRIYSDLTLIPDTEEVVRPLYAVWLQNSDKKSYIRELLTFPMTGY